MPLSDPHAPHAPASRKRDVQRYPWRAIFDFQNLPPHFENHSAVRETRYDVHPFSKLDKV